MIRKLLATTAVAAVLATGAIAQDATQPAPATPAPAEPAPTVPAAPAAMAEGQIASNIIGESVYNGTGEEAQNIGDVNDLVIDKDGKVTSVVVGVGGFLGIGEKNVELEYSKIDWAEKDGDRWIVVASTKEELDALPAFDKAPYMPVAATDSSTTSATPPASTTEPPKQ